MLENLGIDEDSYSAYVVMLRNPKFGVDELAGHMKCSNSQILSYLDTLAKVGLIQSNDLQSGTISLVDPQIGLNALLAEKQSQLLAQKLQVERSKAAIVKLVSEQGNLSRSSDRSGMERVVGLEEIRSRIASIAQNCEREVWSFIPSSGRVSAVVDGGAALTEASLARNIEVRTVYADSVRNNPETMRHIIRLSELGANVRTVPAPSVRLIVSDQEIAVIPIDIQFPNAGIYVVTDPTIVAILTSLFLNVWNQSRELTARRPLRKDALNDQEQYALSLWAQGHTDDYVARKLEVSLRTVRRISESLAEKSHSKSRFQMGVKSVAASWIDPHAV